MMSSMKPAKRTESKSIRRIDLESLVKEFRDFLGEKKWSLYYSTLSRFLLGKLSFYEYQEFIQSKFLSVAKTRPKFINFHNKFLMGTFSNVFRDAPNPNNISSDGFGYLNTLSGKNKRILKLSSDTTDREKLKKTVMGLTVKERRRIKNISKVSSPTVSAIAKKHNQSAVFRERYELLPKIPTIMSSAHSMNNAMDLDAKDMNGSNTNDPKNDSSSAKDDAAMKKNKNINSLSVSVSNAGKNDAASPMMSKNLNLLAKNGMQTPTSATSATSVHSSSASNNGNVTTWTQEVMTGFQTLLSSESYELPDHNVLRNKIVAIMRENGLVGQLNEQVIKVMILGLENYLKNVVECAIDTVKYRKRRYDSNTFLDAEQEPDDADEIERKKKITLTTEDLYDTMRLMPHIIEPIGLLEKVSTQFLKDDDLYKLETINKSGIVDLLPFEDMANELNDNSFIKNKHLDKETGAVLQQFEVANAVKSEEKSGTRNELLWLIHDLLS